MFGWAGDFNDFTAPSLELQPFIQNTLCSTKLNRTFQKNTELPILGDIFPEFSYLDIFFFPL